MFFEAADGSTKTVGNKSGEHNDKTVMRMSAQQWQQQRQTWKKNKVEDRLKIRLFYCISYTSDRL